MHYNRKSIVRNKIKLPLKPPRIFLNRALNLQASFLKHGLINSRKNTDNKKERTFKNEEQTLRTIRRGN